MSGRALTIIVFLALIFTIVSPERAAAEEKTNGLDFILMVDTSSSMERYFDDLIRYIITRIISDSLHTGDTFHLLRFAEEADFELAEKIDETRSLDTVLEKLFFLRQKLIFGKYTDLIGAIEYMIRYAESLPPENPKLLVLLTDGVNDPPEGSPFYGMNQANVHDRLGELARTTIDRYGWTVRIIIYPIPEASGDGSDRRVPDSDMTAPPDGTRREQPSETDRKKRDELLPVFEDTLDADIIHYDDENKEDLAGQVSGFPHIIFPGDLGKQGKKINVPFIIENYTTHEERLVLSSVTTGGTMVLRDGPREFIARPKARTPFTVPITLPDSVEKGRVKLPLVLGFEGDTHAWPLSGDITFEYTDDVLVRVYEGASDYIFIVILILIIVLIAFVVYFIIRMKLFEKLVSDILRPQESRGSHHGAAYAGENLIELRVAFQNPHVGFRNIHRIEEGKSMSVGGGLSSYLIFLVPMPAHIGEIRNEAGNYVFSPIKQDFFPETPDTIYDCIGKEIPAVSKHGYRTTIRFIRYVSPLSQINNLLHSIQRPE